MVVAESYRQQHLEQGPLQVMAWCIGAIDFVDLPGAGNSIPTASHHLRTRQHLGQGYFDDACVGFVYTQYLGQDAVSALKSFPNLRQVLPGERPGGVVDAEVRGLLGLLDLIIDT